MWTQIEPFIANVEKTHNQMSTVASYRTNYQQLVQFKDVFLTNSKNMSSLGKYVSFGGLSVSFFFLTDLDPTERVILVARFIQQTTCYL